MIAGMLEVTILASGSAGNAALVCCGNTRLLVDAGLSARRLTDRLNACGIAPESLDGILLTHEHGDHSGALRVLCKKSGIPVFANRLTAAALEAGGLSARPAWKFFANGSAFSVGSITVEPFSVPHDAADPVGFVIRDTSSAFGVLTDLGYATNAIIDRLRDVHTLLIETNHDEDLLQKDTRRPWSVKQRILSRHGHLSNAAAAGIVGEFAGGRLAQVVIGHLSRDCNHPELAVKTVSQHLASRGCFHVGVHCALQDEVSPKFLLP